MPTKWARAGRRTAGSPSALGDFCSQGVLYAPTKLGPVSANFVVTVSPGGSVTAGLQGTGFPPQ